jgi:hypothetical protein
MNQAATTIGPAVPKPQHIPPAAPHDFDMFSDPACRATPTAMLALKDDTEAAGDLPRRYTFTVPDRRVPEAGSAQFHCGHVVGVDSPQLVWDL